MKKSNTIKVTATIILGMALLIMVGCGDSDESKTKTTSANTLPDSLFLANAPSEEITTVASLKAQAKEGDTVAIKVVVGGRDKLFVQNRAVMAVIDATIANPCTSEDDHCSKPWDYCCTPIEEKIPSMATVQILRDNNRPLAVDLSSVDNLKPLSTLIVLGTVGTRDNQNTLTINAKGIYIVSK